MCPPASLKALRTPAKVRHILVCCGNTKPACGESITRRLGAASRFRRTLSAQNDGEAPRSGQTVRPAPHSHRGACLALNARNAARLEETARECAARGAQVLALPGDVSRQAECTLLASRTAQRFGRIDALVNNAGITMWSRFDAVSDFSVFERLLAVNYLGAVYLK